MGHLDEDFAFLRGVGSGLVGLMIWAFASVIQRFAILVGIGEVWLLILFIYVGTTVMVAGPLWYWIVRPHLLDLLS